MVKSINKNNAEFTSIMNAIYKSSAYLEFKSKLLQMESISDKCKFLDDVSFDWKKLDLSRTDLEFEVQNCRDFYKKTNLIPLFFHVEDRVFYCFSQKSEDRIQVFALHTTVFSYKSFKELLTEFSK